MEIIKAMLAGGIMAVSWAIFVFFLRFWRKTGDRLFAFFAIAFLLLGIERVVIVSISAERQFIAYLLRLCAFLLIILAVVQKNKKK